ncbi:MAG: DUF4249 domain-containing protein [Bacteroidetes bacterium]|jgi:hypothetical protein|nr:DUF4249 domain-containing protein [Bacteroidota bacterium]MBT3747594.1 DUF4249 domain-containing protein [Bacteroidota bacterium]MBT4398214.1 DUF4249 domain-containing protein [Bacteroidota bacterium]MBT4412305.1 DUF4249 domain-containing protein [Bacteroidota bacterium]
MIIRHRIIVSCLLVFSFVACETTEKIDDFPLRPSQLVVNCFFSEGNIWEFQVSKSLSVLDNADLKYIDNATIKLFRDDLLIETLVDQDPDGWYRTSSNLPEADHKYSIEVSSPDFEKVLLSEDIAPQEVPISDVSIIIKDSSFQKWIDYEGREYYGGNVEGSFNILFSDPANIENYYSLSVFYLDSVYDYEDPSEIQIQKRLLYISSDDSAIENDEDSYNQLLLRDVLFNGQDYQLKVDFNDWNSRKGREYYVELTSLQRAGYFYTKSIDDYSRAANDPFAEPVQIFCNIKNGYGIFSGFFTTVFGVSF